VQVILLEVTSAQDSHAAHMAMRALLLGKYMMIYQVQTIIHTFIVKSVISDTSVTLEM
jgi:hypothetical protein